MPDKILVQKAKRYLQQQQELGETELALKRAKAKAPAPAKPKSAESNVSLGDYRSQIEKCQKCSLGKTRIKFVFGDGDPNSKLVFVGEAPGSDEDQQGLPFVGKAGQLLTKIIEAINFKRSQVYICNILKCRPPDNRDPLPDEIELCEPYLIRQLEIIKPTVICTLGAFASQTLLKTDIPISKLRGKIHYYQNIKLVPTFHPAALLRNPAWKRDTWEDVKLVRQIYDQEVKHGG
ncbi:uracil-DNA glycosylase [candidate division TA06 bacterium]|uniref:Type-4 uracil-DNA glycosylase n=1 Tax=candidate division TA06 bacterium TaxID=2250710 RepID=A0A933IA91_UNCT6|nr:uracil-DNA glycosylase [candidate division TA06 bacterium]